MSEVYWSWEADVKDGHPESFKKNVVALQNLRLSDRGLG